MDGKKIIKQDIYNLTMEVERLEDLILHCSIHSGYQECGKRQMTTDEKALFDSATKRALDRFNGIA